MTPVKPETLPAIEELAALMATPDEIGIMIEDPGFADHLLDEESPQFKAYQRGKLRVKLEINKSILSLAKQGSGPAQTLALQLLVEQASAEL